MATLAPSGLKTVNTLASPGQALDDNLNLLNARLGGDIIAQPITGLTGGGATNLDGLVTAGVAVGLIVRIWNGTQLSFYRLTAGTTAESSPTVIRPDDYAASTNEKVWVLTPAQTAALAVRGGLAVGVASPTTPIDLRGAAVLSAGVNMVALLADDTAFAAGVGGGIGFVGNIDATPVARTFASIAGQKENATSGNQQGALVFHTRPSAGNLVEVARFDSLGNLLVGGAAAPASMAKGLVIGNGTAMSANPTNAVAIAVDAGAWKYRSSASGEGTGSNRYVHNRNLEISNVGNADYTMTGSSAVVNFGSADLQVPLPTDGVWAICAGMQVLVDAAGAGDELRARLYNSTDAANVGLEQYVTCVANSAQQFIILHGRVETTAASKTIQARIHNATSARGTIVRTRSYIYAVRLS